MSFTSVQSQGTVNPKWVGKGRWYMQECRIGNEPWFVYIDNVDKRIKSHLCDYHQQGLNNDRESFQSNMDSSEATNKCSTVC